MSKLEMIRGLFEYNAWAHKRILDTAAKLSEEQLTAKSNLSPKGISDTLAHSLGTHIFWLAEWREEGSFDMSMVRGLSGFETVRKRFPEVQAEVMTYIDGLSEEDVARPITPPEWWGDWEPVEIPLWHVMLQVVLHAMQHRAEVAQATSAAGESPGELDYIFQAIESNLESWKK